MVGILNNVQVASGGRHLFPQHQTETSAENYGGAEFTVDKTAAAKEKTWETTIPERKEDPIDG